MLWTLTETMNIKYWGKHLAQISAEVIHVCIHGKYVCICIPMCICKNEHVYHVRTHVSIYKYTQVYDACIYISMWYLCIYIKYKCTWTPEYIHVYDIYTCMYM